jgi:hypothetical protein
MGDWLYFQLCERMRFLLFCIVGFYCISSCRKPSERKCFKSVGTFTSDTLSFESFDKIRIYEHLNCILIQDSLNQVVISGGENLIAFVSCDIQDGFLELKNLNRCNFMRNFKNDISIEIHFKDLINLESYNSERISNLDTLHLKWFAFNALDGAGSCMLNLKAESVSVYIEHGHSDLSLLGDVDNLNINVNNYGACNTRNLLVRDSLVVVSNTVVPLYVNALNTKCIMQTKSSGDIAYYGKPLTINTFSFASGKIHEVQ